EHDWLHVELRFRAENGTGAGGVEIPGAGTEQRQSCQEGDQGEPGRPGARLRARPGISHTGGVVEGSACSVHLEVEGDSTGATILRRRFVQALPHEPVSSHAGEKGDGSSSSSVHSVLRPSLVTAMTRRFGANSASTCLQIPHGGAGWPDSVATAMDVNSRCPAATALATAVRSAQMPAG